MMIVTQIQCSSMDQFNRGGHSDSVYSIKVRAGKRRTYFFDVKRTKGDDFYLTLTESTKRLNDDGVERHKIFLYKEDFNRFLEGLEEVINHVKNELMPAYDYDEFSRRYDEDENSSFGQNDAPRSPLPPRREDNSARMDDEDMSW